MTMPRAAGALIASAHAPHTEKTVMFPLGHIVATPNALDTLARHGRTPVEFLARHAAGDWSELCTEDAAENALSVTKISGTWRRRCTARQSKQYGPH